MRGFSNNYEFSEYLLEINVFMQWPALVRILFVFFFTYFDDFSKFNSIFIAFFGAIIKKYSLNLPTSASMTVRSGAAGNEIGVLNSNIWSSSTIKTNIWC